VGESELDANRCRRSCLKIFVFMTERCRYTRSTVTVERGRRERDAEKAFAGCL